MMPVFRVQWCTCRSCPKCWGWLCRAETSLKCSPSPNHLQQGTSQSGHHFFVTIGGFFPPAAFPATNTSHGMTLQSCVGNPDGSFPEPHLATAGCLTIGRGGFSTPAVLHRARGHSFVCVKPNGPYKAVNWGGKKKSQREYLSQRSD